MRKILFGTMALVFILGVGPALAVELLDGGDFEETATMGIQGWDLDSFATDFPNYFVDSAELKTFDPETAPNDLWLRAFEGGGVDLPGDFDANLLVNGLDFLEWQRGNSPTPPHPSADDLALWRTNLGRRSGLKANAILSQTVPGVVGENYTFKGSSRWEANYSGGVNFLDAGGPLGAIASPTTTTMELAFLDGGGSVIGPPVTLDLRTEQTNFNFWVEHTLNGAAPVGTASVRVTAEARNMVWNGFADDGLNQTAFYDSFSLAGAGAPGTELLSNSDLDNPLPTGLDAWTVTNDPPDNNDIVIAISQPWASRGVTGDTGVFLKPFHGTVGSPVDGTFSQTVPGVEGGDYTFSGWSRWEPNYAGGVDTLDAGSPDGAVPSPTQTLMELAFLDGSEMVIGLPMILDLRTEQMNDDTWREHILNGIAPVGTVSVRVSGSMIDGVGNLDPGQSAFFDDFSLDGPLALLVAATPVPEPATAVSLVLGVVMLGFRRTRQQSRTSA